MIAVIVPFSRPQMADNVRENFGRQRLPEPSALVVVENAILVGEDRLWFGPDAVQTRSAAGRSRARTAGLHKARELGCEWFAFWDDDDFYAPGFLEQCWRHRDKADVIGQCRYQLRDPTGKRWLMCSEAQSGPVVGDPIAVLTGAPVGGLCCPTLFGRVDRALDWTADVPYAEEQYWYSAMLAAGRTLWGIADYDQFALVRHADPNHGHAQPDWQREIKACNGLPLS
jgi:glycosyltransferase involved in cell wall biosynthesis